MEMNESFCRYSCSSIQLGSQFYDDRRYSSNDVASIIDVPSFAEMGYTRFEIIRNSIAAILIGLAPIGLMLLFTR